MYHIEVPVLSDSICRNLDSIIRILNVIGLTVIEQVRHYTRYNTLRAWEPNNEAVEVDFEVQLTNNEEQIIKMC